MYCLIGLVKIELNGIIFKEDGVEHLKVAGLIFTSSGSAMCEYWVQCM
jgi:hypothetical protein